MTTLFSNNALDDTHERPRLQWLDERTVKVRAPAKLNLTLAVGAQRPDGYHLFESLMASVSLHDELTVRSGDAGVRITCTDPAVPVDCENLVYRAASLLSWWGRVTPALDVHIDKRIPCQAGLGGGSSDAAAALLALNELWALDAPVDKLVEIASVLGSDVGFFLRGPVSICRGRGEDVRAVDAPLNFWAVIVKPDVALPTREVYRYHRVSDENCFGLADRLVAETRDGHADWPEKFRNDLEPAAFRVNHDLGRLRAQLSADAGTPVRLSGSGSAMFAVFLSKKQAVGFMQRISDSYPDLSCWLVRNNSW